MAGFNGKVGSTFAESVEDWPKQSVNTGKEVRRGEVGRTVPGTYSISETFDGGLDMRTSRSDSVSRCRPKCR